MFDAFLGLQPAGQFLHLLCAAFDRYYFQAIMVIQVQVLGREYDFPEIVLGIDQCVHELAFMMVIHQRDRTGDFAAAGPVLADKLLAYQFSYCVGSVFEVFTPDMPVELLDKLFVQRHAETVQGSHRVSIVGNFRNFLHVY